MVQLNSLHLCLFMTLNLARSILCLIVPLQLGALCSVFASAATNLTLSVPLTYTALTGLDLFLLMTLQLSYLRLVFACDAASLRFLI